MRAVAVALISVAVTLAVVGALLVLSGVSLLNESNARVQRENSLGCGGANCTSLAPGNEQPEGLEGAALVQIGEWILVSAVGVGLVTTFARRNTGRTRSSP